ncbi:TonB family protein [Pedobacter alpinus]|uniref:TonB family protein n=1 Tax=Pedobacter alpinus TaxID=1590643 RepID=A0ABW5TQC3_9SPHI
MNWVSYLLQINLYLVLFYAFYSVFLRGETFFNWNRVYLVGATFFSVLIPLFQTDWVKSLFVVEQVQNNWLNANVLIMDGFATPISADEGLVLGDYLLMIYILGLLFLSFKLFYQLFKMKQVFKDDKTVDAFSFFKKVKISGALSQHQEIEKHELTHAKQFHSADVLFFEVVTIINWFNPICYLYKKAIKETHEFIADAEAVKITQDKKAYALLLLSKSFGLAPHQLTNNFFNHSLLKTRIKMLQKPKSNKMAVLKYGLSVPLFLLAMVLSSAKISQNEKINDFVKTIQSKQNLEEILVPDEKSKIVVAKDIESNSQKLQTKNNKQLDTIPKTALNEVKVMSFKAGDDDPIFSKVENFPTFPGGIKAFGAFLSENIKYPEEARKANINGRVFCQFVVEKDGSLTKIRVVRGIGGGCDEEAVRVLAISPKWNPGMQNGEPVRVSYTIPIFFQISAGLENAPKKDIEITDEKRQELNEKVNMVLNKALIVIDGKIVETKDWKEAVKPEDIEKIDVLKGEAAIKAYGDKGTNGVIIITKKKN